jgi:hypothetical protein
MPVIPARKWPGKEQRYGYLPGAVGALKMTSAFSPPPMSALAMMICGLSSGAM